MIVENLGKSAQVPIPFGAAFCMCCQFLPQEGEKRKVKNARSSECLKHLQFEINLFSSQRIVSET
jgi:hypothetical protein